MKESSIETKVGFFVLAGLLAMAGLIVAFGKLGNYFRKTYPVIVEFEDARDILKKFQSTFAGGSNWDRVGHTDLSGGSKLRRVDAEDRSGNAVANEFEVPH